MTTFLGLINLYGYKAVLFLMVLENIFPPIPCEIILTFSGFLTTFTTLKPLAIIIVATLGSYLGAILLYLLGYLINYQKLNQLLIKFHFKENALERSVNWFDLYGKIIILLGRLIPIIRSIISIPAGITKMNFFNFSVYTVIGSLIWNAILVYLGVILGNNWQMISFYLNRYSIVVAIVLIIIVIIKRKFLKSKK